MDSAASNGWFSPSMSDRTAMANGNQQVEHALMKTTRPTKGQPYPPTNGDGVDGYMMGQVESQSDFRASHRKLSLRRASPSHPLTQTLSSGTEHVTSTMSFSSDRQVTILKETILSTCSRLITEFDDVDESFIHSMSIEAFLDYVERQRLTHMPHRGSRWDKVLKWTEYFALQISGYSKAVESFVTDSNIAAKLIWTSCRALLEVNAQLVACRLPTNDCSSVQKMPKLLR